MYPSLGICGFLNLPIYIGAFPCLSLPPKNLSWIFLSGFQHVIYFNCFLFVCLFVRCPRWQWVIHLIFSVFEKCSLQSHLSALRKSQVRQNEGNSLASVLQAALRQSKTDKHNYLRIRSALLFLLLLDPKTRIPDGEHGCHLQGYSSGRRGFPTQGKVSMNSKRLNESNSKKLGRKRRCHVYSHSSHRQLSMQLAWMCSPGQLQVLLPSRSLTLQEHQGLCSSLPALPAAPSFPSPFTRRNLWASSGWQTPNQLGTRDWGEGRMGVSSPPLP